MRFYSPYAFIYLISIPVIILFYLLKQQYQEKKVSSLYLWQEALVDLEANTPWQKLKKNLSMILQIAAALLMVLALSNPFITVGEKKMDKVALVIDTSMSMQAVDIKPNRFEVAKKLALDYLEKLEPDTQITFISMGNKAVIEENISNDKSRISEKFKNLKVTNETANFGETVSIINSLWEIDPNTKIILFSDTEFNVMEDDNMIWKESNTVKKDGSTVNEEDNFDKKIGNEVKKNRGIDEKIEFVIVRGDGVNYAITLMSHSILNDGSISLLTVVSNFSNKDEALPLSLYIDGKVADAKEVKVKAGEKANVYWHKIPGSTKILECRIDKEDSLKADNIAWSVINPSTKTKVLLITKGNQFLEKVLKLMDGIDLYKGNIEDIEELRGFDLYIFDSTSHDDSTERFGNIDDSDNINNLDSDGSDKSNKDLKFGEFIPDKLPGDGNVLLFNPFPNNFFTVIGETDYPLIEKSDHELFKYVKDYDFSIYKSKVIDVPIWGEEVLGSDKGTLVFAGEIDKRRVLVFGFDLHHTDMVLKSTFPIVMTNAVDWLIPPVVKNIGTIYPGQEIEFSLNPKTEEALVQIPSGKTIKIAPPFPPAVFDKTDELGVYILEESTSSVDNSTQNETLFAVNAPAEQESNLIKPIDNIRESRINENYMNGDNNESSISNEDDIQHEGSTTHKDNIRDITNKDNASSGGDIAYGGSIKNILLLIVLLVLCIEWWVYANGY